MHPISGHNRPQPLLANRQATIVHLSRTSCHSEERSDERIYSEGNTDPC